MTLSATQQIIYDGLHRDPGPFDTSDLDVAALGAWHWLMAVVHGEAGRRLPVRWPLAVTGDQRATAMDDAKRALIDYYCPGRGWLG